MPTWLTVLIIVVVVAVLIGLAWRSSARKPSAARHIDEAETAKDAQARTEMRRSGTDGPGGTGGIIG